MEEGCAILIGVFILLGIIGAVFEWIGENPVLGVVLVAIAGGVFVMWKRSNDETKIKMKKQEEEDSTAKQKAERVDKLLKTNFKKFSDEESMSDYEEETDSVSAKEKSKAAFMGRFKK